MALALLVFSSGASTGCAPRSAGATFSADAGGTQNKASADAGEIQHTSSDAGQSQHTSSDAGQSEAAQILHHIATFSLSNGGSDWSELGYSVALDDTALVVTAPFEDVRDDAGEERKHGGGIYVFDPRDPSIPPTILRRPTIEDNDGTFPGTLFPNVTPKLDIWGALHVAISKDLIAVGLNGEDSGKPGDPYDNTAEQSGAVLVYDRNDLTAEPQYLKAPVPERNALFGLSLALSDTRLAVSAPFETNGGEDSGAVYVYDRHGNRVDDAPIRLVSEVADKGTGFGTSLSFDGETLVVGAPGDSSSRDGESNELKAFFNGAVYVYRPEGTGFGAPMYITPPNPNSYNLFGFSVAASDGEIVVGAPLTVTCDNGDPSVQQRGAAHVIRLDEESWHFESCLSPRSDATDVFGVSVAKRGDLVLVGAPWDGSGSRDDPADKSRAYSGSTYLFGRDGDSWREVLYQKSPELYANDVFGFSTALAPGLVAIGAPQYAGTEHEAKSSGYSGALYLYSVDEAAMSHSN